MRAFAVLPLLATLALALPLPQTGEDSASSLKAALAHVENSNEAYISIAWAPEASYGDELGVDVDVKVKKDGAWVPHYEEDYLNVKVKVFKDSYGDDGMYDDGFKTLEVYVAIIPQGHSYEADHAYEPEHADGEEVRADGYAPDGGAQVDVDGGSLFDEGDDGALKRSTATEL